MEGDPHAMLVAGDDALTSALLGSDIVTLFENAYVAYARDAAGLAVRILDDRELASDAVHVGFLEVLRQLLRGRRWYDPHEARAVVLRNVRWAALNIHRARRRHGVRSMTGGAQNDDDVLWARSEARTLCEQIVSQLAANHREAIQLHFVDGLTNIEAAQRLGVSVGVFESRLHRAIQAAQRAARSTGLLPTLLALVAGARAIGRRPHRSTVAVAKGLRSVAHVAAVSALLGLGAHRAVEVMHASSAAPRPSAASPTVAPRDSIDNAVVSDATALPNGVLVATGVGNGCHCAEVFHSTDGGLTWEVGSAQPEGAPAHAGSLNGASAPRAVSCATSTEVYCSGHSAGPGMAAPGGSDGGLLFELSGHRLIYFRPAGGLLCSTDGGVTWASTCGVIPTRP